MGQLSLMAKRSGISARKQRAPRCIVIAGPNGSGKTTFAREFLEQHAGIVHFVNADLIAGGLSPLKPELSSAGSRRLLLKELDRLARAKIGFAFESTLSGLTYLSRLKDWKAAGYRIEIVFLKIESLPAPCDGSQPAFVREVTTCREQTFSDDSRVDGRTFKLSIDRWQTPGPCTIIPVTHRYLWSADHEGQKQPTKMDEFSKSVGKALRKSAKRARETARMYGTPVYVWRDGKIVAEKP
jgi:hypothetical protein